VRYLIRQRLAVGCPITYVDATHLACWERRPYIQMARSRNCEIEALFLDVPVDVCIQRNLVRRRVVPEAIIRQMALSLEPPSPAEGFSRVVTISSSSPVDTMGG